MQSSAVQEKHIEGGGAGGMSLFSCRVLSDYEVMPWKNGLGVSSEITVVPPNVNFRLEPFTFRLSISVISSPCSYSLFHGYERIRFDKNGFT